MTSNEKAEVECPYCEETFTGDNQLEAKTKEGIHRTDKHVNPNQSVKEKSKGDNLVDDWRTDLEA